VPAECSNLTCSVGGGVCRAAGSSAREYCARSAMKGCAGAQMSPKSGCSLLFRRGRAIAVFEGFAVCAIGTA
jgi:hypothetical protein